MTTAIAGSTTTGTLPANMLLRVLGNATVTMYRGATQLLKQNTERENFVGPYPSETTYSVFAGGAISINLVNDRDTLPVDSTVPALLDLDADSGVAGVLGPDGTYAALPLDADGNIKANVNHRTGLLDSLLGLPGGAGEIAVATDMDALVTYTGVTGEAVPFYRNGHIGTFAPNGNTTVSAVASGTTGKVVTFGGVPIDAPGFLAAGGDGVTFVVPATSAKPCAVEVTCLFYYGLTDSGTGTVRKLILQYDTNGSGSWTDLATMAAPVTATISTIAGRMVGTVYQVYPAADTAKFRLIAKQDSGGALDLTITNLMIKMYRA